MNALAVSHSLLAVSHSLLAVSHGLLDQPGTVAFLVIFGMGVIMFFLFRSMAKHLRKIQMAARAEAEEAAKSSELERRSAGQ